MVFWETIYNLTSMLPVPYISSPGAYIILSILDNARRCSDSMAASPTTPFTYTPLSSRDSLRLVTLLPGNFDDVIKCELSHAANDAKPPPNYEALSYVWGDPTYTTSIAVNGSLFHVTANLACALRYLRELDKKRVLWIDAICINQQDNQEKGLHVRAMASIYKHSAKVLVWLGEEKDASESLDHPPPMSISEVFEGISTIAKRQSIADIIGNNPWERWTPSLLSLLRRPWFQRLWIVQEAAMTVDPMLLCGKHSMPWAVLYAAHPILGATVGFTANGAVSMHQAFMNLDGIVNCWTLHRYWEQDTRVAAAELARRCIRIFFALKGNFLCSDERDRFYGILGLLGDPMAIGDVPVDYEQSAAAGFHIVAVFLLESRQSLDFLMGDVANFDSSKYPGKPSWVPTWKSYSTYIRGHYNPPDIWLHGEEKEPPNATSADYRLSKDHHILYVKGVVIGTLVGAGTPPPCQPKRTPGFDRIDYREAMSQLLVMWETEVVHLPLARARGIATDVEQVLQELRVFWESSKVPASCLQDNCSGNEETIEAFRQALFHTNHPGSRSPNISEKDCYEALLGRKDGAEDDESHFLDLQVESFSHFKWRSLCDMVPFRLTGGQFGMMELGMDMYQGRLCIVLFAGGPGPVALLREDDGFRFRGPCYVQGLEDEASWLAYLDGRELDEFALI